MHTLAAVMYQQGLPMPFADSQPFKIEEVDLEGPVEGEVLVEVMAAGLCHSDLSTVAGLRKRACPVVGGHEGAGIVREVGRGVSRLKVGDHVVMSGAPGCGQCGYCGDDRPNLCETVGVSRAAGTLGTGNRKLSRNGQPINHYSGISSFAQYAVLTPDTLIKVDNDVPLSVAALYGCGVVTGAGAVFNTARVRPGQTVAVIGLGGVGLSSVMAAKVAGASEIIGIDLLEDKFALALEVGCTRTINARDPDVLQSVLDHTRGGVDYVFEVTGNKNALATAFAITRKGGDVICIGLGATGAMVEYPHTNLVGLQKGIRGSFMGGGNAVGDIARYVRFYKEGRMPVDKLVSGTMGFDQLNLNLDLLEHGTVMRQILLPNG
jgi:Zn-dependent alcohol dehydrogenase